MAVSVGGKKKKKKKKICELYDHLHHGARGITVRDAHDARKARWEVQRVRLEGVRDGQNALRGSGYPAGPLGHKGPGPPLHIAGHLAESLVADPVPDAVRHANGGSCAGFHGLKVSGDELGQPALPTGDTLGPETLHQIPRVDAHRTRERTQPVHRAGLDRCIVVVTFERCEQLGIVALRSKPRYLAPQRDSLSRRCREPAAGAIVFAEAALDAAVHLLVHDR